MEKEIKFIERTKGGFMKKNIINDSSLRYQKRLKISLLLSLTLLITLFLFTPGIASNPYAMKGEEKAIVLQALPEPLTAVSDIKDIPKQSLPKKIVETNDENKVTQIEIQTSFEDSVLNSGDDNRIYIVYETEPKLLTEIRINYPEAARMMGIEGRVFLEIVIEKDGRVSLVRVLKSDNPILNDAASDAVKNALFSPAMTRDIPVRCIVTIPVMFRLK